MIKINSKQIAEAKEVDLRSLVMDSGLKFRRSYNCLQIRCIFHNERNPSMGVYRDNAFCFSCSKNCDVIGFVQQLYEVDFKEAVRIILEWKKENE